MQQFYLHSRVLEWRVKSYFSDYHAIGPKFNTSLLRILYTGGLHAVFSIQYEISCIAYSTMGKKWQTYQLYQIPCVYTVWISALQHHSPWVMFLFQLVFFHSVIRHNDNNNTAQLYYRNVKQNSNFHSSRKYINQNVLQCKLMHISANSALEGHWSVFSC